MSIFGRIKSSLQKTRESFQSRLGGLFSRYGSLSEDLLEELEDILIGADIGVTTTMELTDALRTRSREHKPQSDQDFIEILQEEIQKIMNTPAETSSDAVWSGLQVILVVGVNGVGKTTSIAKLARFYQNQQKKVLLAAGDTFRAAAIDQLSIWGERLRVPVISHQPGGDPGAVVYDAIKAAEARGVDILIVDTAGRLHTKVNLMEELKKVKRVISRELEGAPHQVLLVLDATTGQNGISQARMFHEAVHVDGIILTKLDGTAKGGIVVAIKHTLNIPILYIGTGETVEDLSPFDVEAFSQSLFR
jgi:fused signal recognition particle receptor